MVQIEANNFLISVLLQSDVAVLEASDNKAFLYPLSGVVMELSCSNRSIMGRNVGTLLHRYTNTCLVWQVLIN